MTVGPANRQLRPPWFWLFTPFWPCYWLALGTQTVKDISGIAFDPNGDENPDIARPGQWEHP